VNEPMPHRFTIELESPRSDNRGQAVRRLRGWLKVAWRMFGLRCVRCRESDAKDTPEFNNTGERTRRQR
jgi:hypothetical protein